MGRRIEVELTSTRDDGTWTWRAAGAKQPKGVVDAALLYDGARVGDVVRAEADFEMEGILITAVLPPKDKKRPEPERLEIIGPPRDHQPVTSSLVPKSERPRAERGRGGDREGRDGRPGRDARPSGDRRGGPVRPRDDGPARPATRPRSDAPPRSEGQPRPDAGRGGDRRSERRSRDGDSVRRPDRAERRPTPTSEPAPPKHKRLAPANVHRSAVVESLPPEQRPIAEHVLRGGIPAVRQAVETQNARLRSEGQTEVHAGPLVAMAEQLLPQLKAAEWRDRAEAAVKVVDEVSLRDLRSVVAGADAARDDEGRLLAGTLRQALERRVAEQRDRWVADIAGALDEGRLVRALRLSAHPPDPATRFPAELALRLSETAGSAMSSEATPDRWNTLLEAVVDSPVRRSVKPAGLPTEPGDQLLHAARQASGRVPALAALLGIAMPPPPGPPRPVRPASRPGRAPGAGGGRRRPTRAGARPETGAPSPPEPGAAPASSPEPAVEPAQMAAAPAAAPEPTVEPVEPAAAAEPAPDPSTESVEPAAAAEPAPEPTVESVEPAVVRAEPEPPSVDAPDLSAPAAPPGADPPDPPLHVVDAVRTDTP